MSIGLAFIVAEWCSQSHLSTQDYEMASRGLRRTRWFKKHTAWFRDIPEVLIELALKFRYKLVRGRAERPDRRSLVWTWKTKEGRPEVIEGRFAPITHGSDEERDPFSHNPKGSDNPTLRLQTLQTSASDT
ncbi:MAG: glutamine-dependent nad(+) synthetase [Lasallia pustulata]|uniref:Glutamine-dependent nad(+) synthetase n=1 Tax=Lasallia pustulata TaxID=136370 RepID=A0A5M8PAZ4_9LECA|nr:MAG: glutamine-dependent nad(+) synthetase [Lasallia pustulata]